VIERYGWEVMDGILHRTVEDVAGAHPSRRGAARVRMRASAILGV
jgi:hypothetical protein